jgi:hypothetical protein
MLNVGFAPVMENIDFHWEIFLWGDPPIHPLCDFDLSVPNTWFEYECEYWQEMNILEDQMTIPESRRKFPVPRNPHARTQLYHSQEKLIKLEQLSDPNWVPDGTKYNIYNRTSAQTATAVKNTERNPENSN